VGLRKSMGPLFEPTARTTDPETSQAAARGVKASRIRQQVLHALVDGPAIAEELCRRTGVAWNTLTPRFREIERRGLISRQGKAPASTGRQQTVWRLTQEGWNALGASGVGEDG